MSQIKKGEWYVLDRTSTMSCVTFAQYADRMDAIARVFPVFFFLVAALVATTTMTRMVDENRLQMGTLKALGYSNFSIAGKYLFYALLATILGSIIGMVVGFVVFPIIIWNAYQLVFSLPTFTLYFYPGMAAASMAISAAVIGLATWSACRSSLKEKSAALLLPRAPVAGKRILMVGDRQDDMQGAVNNQLPAAAVLYGYGSREEMEPWNPVLLAQNCEELTQYILG